MKAADHPSWLQVLLDAPALGQNATALLDLAIAIAEASATHGGGPFGAVVADAAHTIVSVGWNRVVETRDSTAHAEIVALRRAQRTLDTHDLATTERGELVLYTSCAPCIQCFGAVYWSGIRRVIAAARAGEAEALGFQEGPVSAALWAAAREDKGLLYEEGATTSRDPVAPFRLYRAREGPIY